MKTNNKLKLLFLSGLVFCSANALAQDFPEDSSNIAQARDGIMEQRKELKEKYKEMKRQLRDQDDGERNGRGFHRGGPEMGGGPAGGHGRMMGGINDMIKNIQDPYQAVGLSLRGMKQHYKKNGNSLDAIKEFDALLASTKDQKMRNVILFTKRQTYLDEKKFDQVLEMDKTIIKENISAK